MSDLLVRRIGRLTTWVGTPTVDAAVVIRNGRVEWSGPDRELPRGLGDGPQLDAAGAAVLPGFVDCHTHAVWAGDRRSDFVARLEGGDYVPGGIEATVAATRAADDSTLLRAAARRIRTMRANGTTTVEVKSGYGLRPDDEARLLEVIRRLDGTFGGIESTYLGAHVVPDGRNRSDYVAEVIASLPMAAAHGARWCDVFCDDGAFTTDEARRILTAAAGQGLGLRMHADQLAQVGASRLAAELRCASADHLDHVTVGDAHALASAGVVGVLVPVASLYTRSGRWSHAALLQQAGVTLAIATDCNPGSAYGESMPLAIQLACLEMGLSVETALRAATLGGAAALRRADIGHLGPGARGDLIVLASDHEVDVVAHLGAAAVTTTVTGGVVGRT